ncbi:hypothetical protein PVAND_014182 [Polypedilum vanderplanki]|uniref:Innexin n=1 Tax=Polypedilum vanderplanki TaxID=319348 RepID=A0A9J6CRK4_POLVA|nr:hypothetical protein PVAND_014182 [Polypedilum vanderplanki]
MGKLIGTIIENLVQFGKDSVKTTALSFRVITKYTAGLISAFICIILMNNLYGDAIECFPSENKYRQAMVLKCWMEGVYLDKKLFSQNLNPGDDVLHNGVGPNSVFDSIDRITFRYYQWIIPMLLLQSFIFYLPYLIWTTCENKIMQKLLGKVSFPVFSDDWEKQRKTLIKYIKDVKEKYHREYAIKYIVCEVFAFAMIVLNILLTKWIISHEKAHFWNGYWEAVKSFFNGDIVKFMYDSSLMFPLQAKCDFNIIGPSGTIVDKDALCILPQNVIIDKIFAFIYVWYIFILMISFLNLVYYGVLFGCNLLRLFDIGFMLERTVTIREVKEISHNGTLGTWFTLNSFRRNLVSIQFQDLCKQLHQELKAEGKIKRRRNDGGSGDAENYY